MGGLHFACEIVPNLYGNFANVQIQQKIQAVKTAHCGTFVSRKHDLSMLQFSVVSLHKNTCETAWVCCWTMTELQDPNLSCSVNMYLLCSICVQQPPDSWNAVLWPIHKGMKYALARIKIKIFFNKNDNLEQISKTFMFNKNDPNSI